MSESSTLNSPHTTREPAGRGRRLGGWVRRHVSVRVVLPLLVAGGFLAYVSTVAVARQSGDELWHIIQDTWWLVLLLTFPYLAARLLVWNMLLSQLRVTIPWRPLVVAFSAGEVTKSLPAGVYVQVWLLGQLRHFRELTLVRSTLATTAMLGLESLLAVPAALVVGVPGQPWVSQTVLAVVLAWLIVLGVAALLIRSRVPDVLTRHAPWLVGVLRVVEETFDATRELISWRTLLTLPPTAAYMFIYVIDLYAITRAAGVHNVSLAAIVGTYALIVLAVIMVPIPTELGITEITGLNILLAYGLSRPTAAIIILSLRLLTTGLTILVAGTVLFLMRAELRPLAR
jgi:uncharacterized membrane protein YbhN (UPF0104 family)